MTPLVSAELYERYSVALGAASDIAIASIEACVGMSASELETAYVAIVTRLAGVTAEVAREFYEAQRELETGLDDYEPQAYARADEPLLRYDAANSSIAALGGLAQQRIMESADNTIYMNMRKDPAKVKWALVPHAGACAWCRLMGSNGFMYSREYGRGEGMRHANCRCTMVADFDTRNPKLDGYDDSALFKEYRNARASVESDAQVEWNSMGAEQRAAYKAKGRGAYDHFLRNRIVARMHAN